MTHRPLRLLGALMAGVLALTACAPGQSEPTTPAGTSAAANEPKQLSYLYFTDGPDEAVTRDLLKQFEAKTGATVNLEVVPFANLEQTLQARLAGNNAPDVARLANITPFKADLLDLNKASKADLDNVFIDGAKTITSGANGELLAVPSDLTMNGPIINVDLFTKAGVPVPTKDKPWKSWQEMIDAATKVKQAAGTEYGIAMDVSAHRYSTMLSQYGTTLYSKDGKSALDEAKAAKAIQQFADVNNSGLMPKDLFLAAGSKYKAANEIFLAQQVPVYLSGNWQVAAFDKSAKFQWAAVPNPCQERCGGMPGGKFMAAFKASKSPTLASQLVAFMNSKEAQTKYAQGANFLPTRKDLIKDGITYSTRANDMATFLADVAVTPEDTYGTTYSPAFSAAGKTMMTELGSVLQGKTTSQQAATNIRAGAEKALKDAGQ